MTTTDMTPTPPTTPIPIRRLRRSRQDRFGAGVAGGLGEYFGVDPVLFRVLFATAAFFGGSGILAYLLAWAVIPEQGTEQAAIDGWLAGLRRRHVPFWLLAIAAAVLLWIVAFSWWAPGPFIPVIAVVIVLIAIFGRRGRNPERAADQRHQPVSLDKTAPRDTAPLDGGGPPSWVRETRQWASEAREARRARARRAYPVKIVTLLALVATIVTLGLIDVTHGIQLRVYFWLALAVIGLGLLVGLALRRTPWVLTALLVPAILGVVAFGTSRASLHDGSGQRNWTPVSAPAASYRSAFGDSTLDLRSLQPQDGARYVSIEQAAGRIRIIAPKTLELTVRAHVHFGVVTLDGENADTGDGGVQITRIVEPLATATGQPITVNLHLGDGRVDIERR